MSLDNIPKIKVLIWAKEKVEKVSISPSQDFSYQVFGPHEEIDAFFSAYLNGKSSSPPPLDWEVMTPFVRKVLKALQKIDFGKTITYGELAKQIHAPKSCRAVGQALGCNPFPLFLPCHRVVAKRGIGGFSFPLLIKQQLLLFESLS